MRFLSYCTALTFAILVWFSSVGIAQPAPDDPPVGDPDENPVPVTGIELLLVAGGALGGYKLFSKSKKEE